MKTNRNKGESGVFGVFARNIRLYAFQAFGDALSKCLNFSIIGGIAFKLAGSLEMESSQELRPHPLLFQGFFCFIEDCGNIVKLWRNTR